VNESALIALAAIAFAAGCSSPTTNADPPRGRSWLDAGTPATSTVPGGDTRYFKDENGVLWDDRGKKRDNIL
jgi:hypothetical protein